MKKTKRQLKAEFKEQLRRADREWKHHRNIANYFERMTEYWRKEVCKLEDKVFKK